MRKTIVVCDICGKEMDCKELVELELPIPRQCDEQYIGESVDVCNECASKFYALLCDLCQNDSKISNIVAGGAPQ